MNPLDTGQYMHTGLFSKRNPLFQPITKNIAPNSKKNENSNVSIQSRSSITIFGAKEIFRDLIINIMSKVMITDDISE